VATIFSQGRFNMRKVLLATTALVALNVSAASADISLSGGYDFSYYSYSDGTSEYAADGNVKLKATSTTDSGIDVTVYQSVGIHTGDEEDSYIKLGGDFGTIQLGGADSVIDGMDGAVSHFANDWTNLTPAHATICADAMFQCRGEAGLYGAIGGKNHGGDGQSKIGYVSPSISGATVAASSQGNGDELYIAVKYSMGPVTAMYGTGSTETRDDDAVGVGVTFGDTTVRYQTGNSKVTGNKVARTEYGVTHSMGDIGLFAGKSSEKEKTGGSAEFNISGIGLTYAVAPGLKLTTEYWKNDNGTTSENSTSLNLSASF
jgi:hypothetical protein